MIWGQNFKFLLSQFIVKLDLEMTFGNVVECLQGHLLSAFDGGHLCFFQEVTVEPRYNSPRYNERFFYPRNSKMYEEEPRYNETSL